MQDLMFSIAGKYICAIIGAAYGSVMPLIIIGMILLILFPLGLTVFAMIMNGMLMYEIIFIAKLGATLGAIFGYFVFNE